MTMCLNCQQDTVIIKTRKWDGTEYTCTSCGFLFDDDLNSSVLQTYVLATKYGTLFAYTGNSEGVLCIPCDGRFCRFCDGEGFVTCSEGHRHECDECDGNGLAAVSVKWNEAMTEDEYYRWCTQNRYLEERYGTTHPRTIKDYWEAV